MDREVKDVRSFVAHSDVSYEQARNSEYLNRRKIVRWMSLGVFHSIVVHVLSFRRAVTLSRLWDVM